jgi:hypothetical protein
VDQYLLKIGFDIYSIPIFPLSHILILGGIKTIFIVNIFILDLHDFAKLIKKILQLEKNIC